MKCNAWTLALLSAGLISVPAISQAEEKPNAVLSALSATTLSGYVDTSMEWNFGTGNAALPPYAFGGASKADGFNLDVVKLSIEKPVDAADVWGAGYKVDLLAGPDANAFNTQSFYGSSGLAGNGDFGVKQAYIALHAPVGNGLDFKLGTWDTIIGYEVFEAGSNPNFTRSYGYTMEPTTHTGAQASYTFCDWLSANVAIADSFGPKINERAQGPNASSGVTKAESFKTYMGSLTFTAPTNTGVLAGSTLTFGVINGFNSGVGTATAIGANETSWYLGGTLNTPVSGLKVGFAFDDLDVHHTGGETWCIGGYVAYQATEKLSFYGRGEYLRDRGEQKLFAVRTFGEGLLLTPTAPDRVLELTATVQYDLWKNVLSRLELRWDHSLSGQAVWGNINPDTGTGDLKNEWLLAANLIYKF